MKGFCIIIVSFLFSALSLAQQIFDLNGWETQSGKTYLFYRFGDLSPYTSIFKFDTETQQDTIFLYGYRSDFPPGDTGKANNDFEFFPNDSINFISVGNELNVDFWGTIYRNDTLTFSIPFDIINVDISKQNPQKVFAGGDYNLLFRSFDGGYNFPSDSIMQFSFLSLSPFNDNIFFGLDSLNRLIKSFDGGNTSVLVDTLRTNDLFKSKFLYDSDQQHIYRVTNSYGKYVFLTSNNNGNQFSWANSYESDYPLYVSNDQSLNGTIYLANRKNIYKSTNYGLTFSLFKSFDSKITGIYKKPNSDILFASTKYNILKITPDTVTTIKSIPIPTDLYNYYPLKIGNKWIYNAVTYIDDFPTQIIYGTIVREVTRDSIASNGHKYFLIKQQYQQNSYNYYEYYLERIDTATGKVFRYDELYGLPNNEIPIDDLTAEVGDTIHSGRFGYYPPYTPTILIDQNYFTNWDLKKPRKVFYQDVLGTPIYSLSMSFGLDSLYYSFDFGYTTWDLRGCIINGIVYGDTVLSVEEKDIIVKEHKLNQNYPNPFNPTTRISWQTPAGSWQTLKVYDILGNEVATLVDEYRDAGKYEITFNASNLASGVYFYRLKAGNFIETKKMILLR